LRECALSCGRFLLEGEFCSQAAKIAANRCHGKLSAMVPKVTIDIQSIPLLGTTELRLCGRRALTYT